MDLRSRFLLPGPERAVELRAFTHGLMPRTVPAMMQRFTEDWRRHGADAWNAVPNHWRPGSGERVGWWMLPEYLGDHFVAPLLGAAPGTCILQPNVHHAVQHLFSAPEVFPEEKDEVVVTEAAFPSVLHSARRWCTLLDATLRVVPYRNGFVDRAAVLDAVTGRTALVFLSHVGFTSGEKLPDAFLRTVADRVHAAGGLLAVDGYHATGSVPVDVEGLGADLYFGGLLKEACGASGNAFVYVRSGLDLRPRLAGWFGDADPFTFGTAPAVHPDVRRRFLGGTTAVAPFYHAVEGVRLLLEAGLDAVRADSLRKTAYSIERADAARLALRSPREAERRSAMIVLEVPEAGKLCAYLKQRHVYTDSRQGRLLRLAPFVWNTTAELERAFDAIDEAGATGAYRRLSDAVLRQQGPVT